MMRAKLQNYQPCEYVPVRNLEMCKSQRTRNLALVLFTVAIIGFLVRAELITTQFFFKFVLAYIKRNKAIKIYKTCIHNTKLFDQILWGNILNLLTLEAILSLI